jgi:putative Mn2+ efflux pump MntP
LLIAVGVSADAFAVALGKGLQLRTRITGRAFVIAGAFGLAQAVMPVLGWLLGSSFAAAIAAFDHWVAFGLLAAVGTKMLWEALRDEDLPEGAEAADDLDTLSLRELLLLAVATSIDALAVGVSFAFFEITIWGAVLVIGATTFALSFLAVIAGNQIGRRFQGPAEVAGGVILILIGVRILAEDLGLL